MLAETLKVVLLPPRTIRAIPYQLILCLHFNFGLLRYTTSMPVVACLQRALTNVLAVKCTACAALTACLSEQGAAALSARVCESVKVPWQSKGQAAAGRRVEEPLACSSNQKAWAKEWIGKQNACRWMPV